LPRFKSRQAQNPFNSRQKKALASGQSFISRTVVNETVDLIHEAIEFHIEGMLLHGERVPEPVTLAETVEVA